MKIIIEKDDCTHAKEYINVNRDIIESVENILDSLYNNDNSIDIEYTYEINQ